MIKPILFMVWVALLILTLPVPVRSHQSETGMVYDPDCCSNRDCALVTDVKVHPDGSRTITNKLGFVATFPKSFPIRPSTDGKFHACILNGMPLCLYSSAGM